MISVCMASYNGDKYIKEQIVSILSQLNENDELIISDDNSTDKTRSIIESINDKRIKIFHNYRDKNGYTNSELVSSNFENAIKKAKGDIIFLSDQDDLWREDKVEIIIDYLRNKDCELVVSNANLIVDGKVDLNLFWYTDRKPIRNFFLRRGKYHGCCMAFKSNALDYILPFPKKIPLHDSWIGLITELIDNACFIDEPLVYYRVHNNNTSLNIRNSFFYKITYRLRLLSQIYFRVLKYKLIK